ncbi:MAG: asparaginase [Bacteriovorax sp.]|jgi:L-asparaginase II
MTQNKQSKDPFIVEVTRGPSAESQHLVDFVIMNADKKILASYGDITKGILPRSAIKMLQALLLVESGAYESLGLDHRHLALASSSHHADHVHTDLVHDWLHKLNLCEDNLRCGPQNPSRESVRDSLIRQNLKPHRGHNNCSGKHSGILSVCIHKNYDTKNYDLYNHPVQQDIIRTLSEVYEYNLSNSPYGVDGCGIPTISTPLYNLTLGHINLANRDSGKLILESIAKAPEYISGDNNFCTEIVRATNGRVFAKVGAEGVYCAFSPSLDIFISLKVRDGAGRASEFATANLLKEYGCINKEEEQSLMKFLSPKIKNLEGAIVGELRMVKE